MNRGPMLILRERFQWGSYGFVAGIVLDAILGWLFHGVVGTIIRFGLVALLLVPLFAAFLVWRRLSDRSRGEQDATVVSRTVVVDREGREER